MLPCSRTDASAKRLFQLKPVVECPTGLTCFLSRPRAPKQLAELAPVVVLILVGVCAEDMSRVRDALVETTAGT